MTAPRTDAPTELREVLVVDDDEALRCALVECLGAAEIAAFEACDGVDALRKIRAGRPPCALLIDIDMPRLDGPGLVAALRADRTLTRVPVITMTAGTAPLALDTLGHLAKPFDSGSLLALLFRACRSCALCDGDGPVIGSLFVARRRADLHA